MSGHTGCSTLPIQRGDLFSPISECVGILHETDITERAKCCVVEALAARKITDAGRDVIKHRKPHRKRHLGLREALSRSTALADAWEQLLK